MHSSFFLLPVLAAAIPAQAIVSPNHFTVAEGNTSASSGLGHATAPARLLQVHEDVGARTISALSFRRDGVTVGDHAALSLLCTLTMSTARTTAAAPDQTFDNNHGGDRRTVATNQVVQLPAVPYAGFNHPFTYRLPLATPYQHTAAGPLCFDLQVSTRSSTSTLLLDAASGANSNPGGNTRSIGTGCRITANSNRATISGFFQPNWPQGTMTLGLSGHSLPATQLATLAVGDSTAQWGPLPLPFELPGTASAPSGACTVLTSILVTVPQFTTATGGLNATVGFATHPSMGGRNLSMQLIAPAPGANDWGLVLTNAVQFHFASPWTSVPVGAVEGSGFGATGTARARFGQIVRFE